MEFTIGEELIGFKEENQSAFLSGRFQNARRGMIAREHVKNIFEAPFSSEETERLAFIEPVVVNGVPKLAFINSVGVGFEGDELADLTEGAGSTKELEANGGNNKGEGAKGCALRFNGKGIVWTSRKGDQITRVTIYRNTHGYFARQTITSEQSNVFNNRYVTMDWEDLSEEDQKRYDRFTGDFFDVKLLGNSDDQNTFLNPYGDENPKSNVILREITTRFSTLKAEKPVNLFYVELDKIAYPVELFDQIASKSSVKSDTQTDPITGDQITYYYCADEKKNPFRESYGFGGCRLSIEHKGEQFAVRQGEEWSYVAGKFGFAGLARFVSVVVKPNRPSIHESDDRTTLLDAGEDLTADDFISEIRRNIPKWLQDIIEKNVPQSSKDIQEQLNKFMKTLLTVSVTLGASDESLPAKIEAAGGKKGEPRSPTDDPKKRPHGKALTTKVPGNGSQTLETPVKITMSGIQGHLVAPNVSWIEETWDGYEFMKGVGCSYERNSPFFFMNASYPVLDEIVNKVINKYFSKYTGNPGVFELVKDHMKDVCAVKVGKAIVRNIVKVSQGYTRKEIYDNGLSRISLTVAFEECLEYSFLYYVFNTLKKKIDLYVTKQNYKTAAPVPTEEKVIDLFNQV